MKNLLSQIRKEEVRLEPFPHVIVRNALDENTCLTLLKNFPPLEIVTKGKDLRSNRRFDYTFADVARNPSIHPLWREFLQAHVTGDFFTEVKRLFGEAIRLLYPSLNLARLKTGVQSIDSFKTSNLLMDAHISLNTAVRWNPASVRRAHIDDAVELYAGLLYLRHPQDYSHGGNLKLYRTTTPHFTMYGQYIPHRYLEPIGTVPYERGMFVFFINTPLSIHGVTVREKTDKPRYFVNIIGNLARPLFDVGEYQAPAWRQNILKLYQRAKNKVWRTK